ncbi:hypothetical protein MVEN_00172900 [Mycena venus]|uniref:Uncharacterized protein n=1 Tax=Mycena venus TaxID=2733690 RepID=A0A8H6Z0Q0_9AGAR|nr:hypothetical protein MVEN_00172900 [Mycena venus]
MYDAHLFGWVVVSGVLPYSTSSLQFLTSPPFTPNFRLPTRSSTPQVRFEAAENALEKPEAGLQEAKQSARSLDVKAEQADSERQQLAAEKERDGWEAKAEEPPVLLCFYTGINPPTQQTIEEKYRPAKAELDKLVAEMEGSDHLSILRPPSDSSAAGATYNCHYIPIDTVELAESRWDR